MAFGRKDFGKQWSSTGTQIKIIRISENIYKDAFASVKGCRELSGQFKTVIEVLQGCVLSPLLFNLFLELIVVTAQEDEDTGVQTDGV